MKIRLMPLVLRRMTLLAGLLVPAASPAATLTFNNVTNNNPSSVNVASQLDATYVADAGPPNGVLFTFTNKGSIDSIITTIAFQDTANVFTGLSIAFESTGVDFNIDNSNTVLDGLGSPAFDTEYAVDRASGAGGVANGIDESASTPFETLQLRLALATGKTFTDVVTALSNGGLRVGMHVQSIGTSGKSDKFLNAPPTVVPEPSSLALGLGALGLLGVAGLRRRRAD